MSTYNNLCTTISEADRLQKLAQDCGCDLEFQTK